MSLRTILAYDVERLYEWFVKNETLRKGKSLLDLIMLKTILPIYKISIKKQNKFILLNHLPSCYKHFEQKSSFLKNNHTTFHLGELKCDYII